MRKLITALFALSITLLAIASAAAAFEGGGRKPSEAPLIAFGPRYSAQLNNHKSDANYGGYKEASLWHLPPLSTHDTITVNWHVLPFTKQSGFPVCMVFAQGIDDFNWGTVFGKTIESGCYQEGPVYAVSGSGTAQTTITAQETNSTSSYLEFYSSAFASEPSDFETFPYDFSVEAPRHYLGVAFTPISQVGANGFLHATVTRADGSPAPDGLAFTLTATWSGNGIATYTTSTAGGGLSYGLSLPETAIGKNVTFVVARAADSEYQAASSTKLVLPVKKAKPTIDLAACEQAKRKVQALARQRLRLRRHAGLLRHGPRRASLSRRARHVAAKLRDAHSQASAACTAP